MAERVAAETRRTERSDRLHARERAARQERDAARLAREYRHRAAATTSTAVATATAATAGAASTAAGAATATTIGEAVRRTAKVHLFGRPQQWGAASMRCTAACTSAPALCRSAPTLLAPTLSGLNAAQLVSSTCACGGGGEHTRVAEVSEQMLRQAWPSPALQHAQGTTVDVLQGTRLGACIATPVPSPLRSWLNQAAHEVAMREVATREFALPH